MAQGGMQWSTAATGSAGVPEVEVKPAKKKPMSKSGCLNLWDHWSQESSTMSYDSLKQLLCDTLKHSDPDLSIPEAFLNHVCQDILECLPGSDISKDAFLSKIN